VKIIPAIDLMDGKVVRLVRGDPTNKTIYSDDPIYIANKWKNAGADLIHLVDLDATLGQGSNLKLIKEIVNKVSIPIQVAGGLRDEKIIGNILETATRIVLGTFAFNEKKLLQKLLDYYKKDRIVISVDHVDGLIVTHGWTKNTGLQLIDEMKKFTDMGFSEFLLTNVNRDGTLHGPDLKFLQSACNLKNVNVISSGGISSIDDILQVKSCNAFGVILGKSLYENKITIEGVKKVV